MRCKIVSLGDICSQVYSGGTPKSTENLYYKDGNIPWLNTKEIHFNRIYNTERNITEVGLNNSSAKWVYPPAVVVAMYGATAGNIATIHIPLTTNQACCNLIVNQDKADYRFVYYYLKWKYKELSRLANGGAQQNLNVKLIKEFIIELPNKEIQNKFANILSTIDDKIETNTAINKNLESEAQAIFKSWFVDFEPFGGEMPRDWKYGNLEDLGQDIVCGKTPSTKRKEYYGGNIPFVTIPDMHNQIYITETERYLSIDGVKTQPTKTLPKNTICVSCIGTAGLVSLTSKECQTNQQINSIIPKDHISPYYVYFLMKSLSETIIRLGGSGSTIVNLNKGQFAKIEVVIPNLEDMSKFTYIVKSNFEMILSNQIENTRLAALRDTLIPRLMSGEIDVENVEV